MANQKKTAKNINAAQNRANAVQLRLTGYTFDQIGRSLGVSRQRAHQYVKEELEKLNEETREATEILRDVANRRFEYMINRMWHHAFPQGTDIVKGSDGKKIEVPKAPNLDYVAQLEKVMGKQSKLLGIEAPERISMEFHQDLEEFASRLGQLAMKFIPEDMRDRYALELRTIIEEMQGDDAQNEKQ